MNRKEQGSAEHPGKDLLEKHGCLGCHSLDGSSKVGPTFKGIWGRSVTVLSGGVERTLIEDDDYLRRSILEPKADVVKGFPQVMPALPLKDEELTTIIDFFKSGGATAPKRDGAKLAREKGCLGCHSLDGSKGVGPTFKGLYRSTIKVLVEGKPVSVTVDDAYLTESIVKPAAKIVEGFQPLMPTYPDLSPEDIKALMEFIEEIR